MIAKGGLRFACIAGIYCQSLITYAENTLPLASDTGVNFHVSSVDENIRAMDKDGDGMVSVVEVRAFIESRHGKAYQKDVLDEMESSINGKSCSTPFAKPTF